VALYGLILVACLYCVFIAVLSVLDPTWATYMTPYSSPPFGAPGRGAGAGGVAFIVFPIVVIGVIAYRLWWRVRIDLEARRERRHRNQ
jgi:hypothetical protein